MVSQKPKQHLIFRDKTKTADIFLLMIHASIRVSWLNIFIFLNFRILKTENAKFGSDIIYCYRLLSVI